MYRVIALLLSAAVAISAQEMASTPVPTPGSSTPTPVPTPTNAPTPVPSTSTPTPTWFTNPGCNTFTGCPTGFQLGYVSRSPIPFPYCANIPCTTAECCVPKATCQASDCLASAGFYPKIVPPPPCAGATCTTSECCTTSKCIPALEFECSDKSCIPKSYRCDGQKNCLDNSDEWECPYHNCLSRDVCGPIGQFRDPAKNPAWCPGFLCTSPECCTTTPPAACIVAIQFQCSGDKSCIPKDYRCDGLQQCADNSDEWGCSYHNCMNRDVCGPAGMYRDIAKNPAWCPGFFCSAPECCTAIAPAPCLSYEFQCKGDKSCVPKDYTCDGVQNCSDNSDEWGCSYHSCLNRDVCGPAGQFRDVTKSPAFCPLFFCSPAECCTAVQPAACSATEFTCTDKACIPLSQKCNKVKNCSDNSDEWGCPL